MKEITCKDDFSLDMVKRYACTDLTMSDIASSFTEMCRKMNLDLKITAENVSNAVYNAIFYERIPKDMEKEIIEKIASNRKRHCIRASSSNIFAKNKYNRAVADREEIKDICDTVAFIQDYKRLLEEAESVKSLDISDFISSEDEIDYISPRTYESIESDIEYYKNLLKERGVDAKFVERELQYLLKRADAIKEKYDKI